ncbi:inorganic phosphate transmembrane transporter [Aureococcus anophagefferens]|nr:inorganic phosphate transmembrane transporter [Aureococcus anophagefferens]
MDKQGSRWIVVAGFVACFLMAMAMGANDVANAFGTSVGAGVVTLRQALVLAAVCNVGGAVLMSGAVTETIRKGIVDVERFSGDSGDGAPEELMLLMLCAMVGSVAYVGGATALRLPVSTTQAVLGGLVGAMISRDRGGGRGVRWSDGARVCRYSRKTGRLSCGGVAGVVLQWFVAPLISMQQFHPHTRGWDPRNANDPVNRATALEVVACALVGVAGAWGALTVFTLWPGALRFAPAAPGPRTLELAPVPAGGSPAEPARRDDERPLTDGDGGDDAPRRPRPSAAPTARPRWPRTAPRGPSTGRRGRFGAAQVAARWALAAFAAGANDVANEVAPVAAIWQTWADGEVRSTARTPKWLFLYAGAGVAAGLGLFGARAMRTVGRDATKMTPARGFNIELGYSLASLVASAEGWPVSTTQLCVGAVVGVGLGSGDGARASDAVNTRLLAHLPSWVATPLVAGLVAALAYACLRPAL